ncbi:UNVERIFIED_CONTAM: Retrovirus-related Pol polyprotein from type-2 retrotransposable element R2DM [Sesamum latifolium]|uniref:Retrovirus-related Pol polyprotein from type-2 retrotransposable element R2DM n=1 Tax=Sesamum latifolium TaxID=2727402 RepID=A0AAW2XMP6_9LAMI
MAKRGDQCSKIFFRKIAARHATQKIFHINSKNGDRITEELGVAAEFVGFYTTLLGGRRRDIHVNLMFLQLWARYIIPNDERETMIWAVEREEIKAAFFDIDEDKAPGPDGFSAGFFKAAWSVIGDELTTAIQDFFVSGKMLKQVNATVLSLIPKVANPTTVAEFRPISCCNVLYKAITKIIVQRMHAVMGKIVSPSQNAFVPGRRISNNTLIGQELFHGYNRQNLPPCCALKVDLRKAYDTLEWDFIHAMLSVFGFPEKMIMWIVECISTTTYSVALNGELHGFFPGARGIRQGDPMSPYLFVLAMEILHLILLQKLNRLSPFSITASAMR